MFAPAELAHRLEAAEARLTLGVGRRVARRLGDEVVMRELGGGAAVSSSGQSPFDKVIGIGFAPLDWSAFDGFASQVLGLGRSVQAEVATLADPAVLRGLTARGFQLVGFENVLGIRPSEVRREGSPVVRVTASPAEELETWIDVVCTAFLSPDVYDGPAPHDAFARAAIEQAMRDLGDDEVFTRVLARRGDELAGGASFRIDGTLAQMTGAATLPAHRRHGVQTTLLAARLALAAEAGCDLAVITTAPGSVSQANVMKAGFSLLYARAVLVKTP
jgi:GNAT superfamily N-acetyltransferase